MKNPSHRQKLSAAIACGAAVVLQSVPVPLPAREASAGALVLEEIIVTAQRRTQSLTDVPLSISAYDNVRLEQIGAKGIADIARITPGVSFGPAFLGTTNISIRGIASSVGTATTGVYIDDTPIQVRALGAGQNATNTYPRIFDLDRVEVLRGPQGTLFGAGSEGGTIRFITATPSLSEYSAHARAELGHTNGGDPSYELGAAGGGPIVADRLGFRVSAYGRREGGWIERIPFPGNTLAEADSNEQDAVAANATFGFAATDSLTITPSLFYQREHRDDVTQYWKNLSDPAQGRLVSGMLLAQPATDEFYLPGLKIVWDLGDIALHSNTSYLERTRDAQGDYSFIVTQLLSGNYVGPRVPAPTNFFNPQESFTQELRLQSADPDSRWVWVVGGFYQALEQEAGQYVYIPQLEDLTQALFGLTALETFGGVPALADGLSYFGADTSRDEQLAGFGQVDYKLTDALTLTAGVRVAKAKFSYSNEQGGPFNGGPTGSTGDGSETAVSPKYGISYKAGDNVLLYASAAKGFRIGGSNTPVPRQPCAADLAELGFTEPPPEYDSDTVWSYEAGSKATLFDNRLQVEASAFYIDWTDIQSVNNLLRCGFQLTVNRGSAVSQGVDLQVGVRPVRGLTLTAAAGYTEAEFVETIPNLVTRGNKLPISPLHVSVSGDYSFPVFASDGEGYVYAAYDYSSSYDLLDPDRIGYDRFINHVPAYRYATIRMGLRRSSWDVSVFVNNLFDYKDELFRMRDSGETELVHAVALRPRTVGVTATFRY